MILTESALFDAVEATWPAAAYHRKGPWLLRQGRGGGKRVSSISADGVWTPNDIAKAERACADLGQEPLFQLRRGQADLDTALAARGYAVVDPVDLLAAPVSALAADIGRLDTLPSWPPLAVQAEIWAGGGIGPTRLAVMDRATDPKTALLGRRNDHPVATAFIACHGPIAMLHALEVVPEARRQGIARVMMQGAANWAARQGAQNLAALVVKTNQPAQNLYKSLGMAPVGHYFYRIKKEAELR
jgi:N-acetylglutamate synthase